MARREISKPTAMVYWAVTDGNDIVHQGRTAPDQLTVTGLGDLIESDTLDGLIAQLDAIKELFPDLPTEVIDEKADRIYNDNGTLVAPKRS